MQQLQAVLGEYTELIALVALLLALIALALANSAGRRGTRALDRLGQVDRQAGEAGVAASILEHQARIDQHASQLSELTIAQQELRLQVAGCVQRVGLVRYDAFGDMGGKLSFSVAFLDEKDNGCVMSALVGRDQTRVYGKPLAGGSSAFDLLEEERQAIKEARLSASANGKA